LKNICYPSAKNSAVRFVQDSIILSLLACLLYYGACWYNGGAGSDVLIYQCYAVAFWQGPAGFHNLPAGQCTSILYSDKYVIVPIQRRILYTLEQHYASSNLIHFFAAQSPVHLYHSLPEEYPFLALLPFSLGLIAPAHWYLAAFATWMLLFALCVYFVLQRWRSRATALVYALYLMSGAGMTVAARFDLVPAALTLFAVICAGHKRWNWSFVFLALATVVKLYPATLLIPFLLALHQGTQGKWYAWHKWLPVGLFVGICIVAIGVSLLLNVVGTIIPLGYFAYRPVEVESVSASILWLCSLLGKTSLTYIGTFGSMNVTSPLSANVASRMTILLIIGLLYTWWLQWQRRIDLGVACLLTVLIVIVTGKVFSPQYLIWVIPLAAYVGQANRRWILFWTVVGLLTSWIYPVAFRTFHVHPYTHAGLFYSIVVARNFLLFGFIFRVLVSVSYKRVEQPSSAPAMLGQPEPAID
jgi:hypothetical protein